MKEFVANALRRSMPYEVHLILLAIGSSQIALAEMANAILKKS